jgi:hypothetical protein
MDLLTRHTHNKFDWWAVIVLTITVFLLPFFVFPTRRAHRSNPLHARKAEGWNADDTS